MVYMSSNPEEDVHTTSSVARQVFPEAIPTVTAQESEAKEAEDIQVALADEREEEEYREVILPTIESRENEDVIVPDLPVVESTEAPAPDSTTAIEATPQSDAPKATEDLHPSS